MVWRSSFRWLVPFVLIVSLLLACTGPVDEAVDTTNGMTSPEAEIRRTTPTVPTTTAAPVSATVSWPISTPEAQGMNSTVLGELVDGLVALGDVDTVMITRNGNLVLNASMHPFRPELAHILHSATKSVVATLVGIAIDEGHLDGVDVPVVSVLPESAIPDSIDDRKASMTVGNALAMASGLDCADFGIDGWGPMERMIASDDWVAHVMALPMASQPGTEFRYCSGVTHLLSAILTEVTGQTAAEYAERVLFSPLGITEYRWPKSPEGNTIGYGELSLHASDLMKIGYLYLEDGEWDGAQVVSSQWISDAVTTQVTPADALFPQGEQGSYGYQWWLPNTGTYLARGLAGQRIFVFPDLDVVAVVTAGVRSEHAARLEALVTNHVRAAVGSDVAVPPDDEGKPGLAQSVAAAAAAPLVLPVDVSPLVPSIDGATYAFEPNEVGYQGFAISFDASAVTVSLEVLPPPGFPTFRFQDVDQPRLLVAGFDGQYRYASAWGHEVAARGTWTNEETLAVEWQYLGLASRGYTIYAFTDDGVDFQEVNGAYGTYTKITAHRTN